MSEVSDSPDVGDVLYINDPSRPLTREDRMLCRIDNLKLQLRSHPLVPLDPRNPSEPFLDMASGVRLPDVHCAFRGCRWCTDIDSSKPSMGRFLQWEVEWLLFKHLMQDHAEAFQPELQTCNMEATPGRVPTNFDTGGTLSAAHCAKHMAMRSFYASLFCLHGSCV